MKRADLVRYFPQLFHMAEAGSWPSIVRHGLLSTSALLDLYGIGGEERRAIESARRPRSVALEHPEHGRVVVSDNAPLREEVLRAILVGMEPAEFYRLLNARVFFWPTRARLERMLNGRLLRFRPRTIVTVDTAELLERHGDRVKLSPINSGATGRTAPERGRDTFLAVEDYPFDERRRTRSPKEALAEVTVEGGVPDVADLAVRVEHREPDGTTHLLHERPAATLF